METETKTKQILDDNKEVFAYYLARRSFIKYLLFLICGTCSFGIIFLWFFWYPQYKTLLLKRVREAKRASRVVFFFKEHKTIAMFSQKMVKYQPHKPPRMLYIIRFHHSYYEYKVKDKLFVNLNKIYSKHIKNNSPTTIIEPLSENETTILMEFYGPNTIYIKRPPLITIFLTALLKPLNLYDMVLIINNFNYGSVIYFYMLLFFIIVQTSIYIFVKNNKRNRINQLSDTEMPVNVIRTFRGIQRTCQISSKDLVLGDIIVIESKMVFPCDIAVINGSCLIDQAVLTGESAPILKTQKKNIGQLTSSNIIHGGSTCLMNKTAKVKGVVINTSWSSVKGNMISKLINVKFVEFKFIKDMYIFISILFTIYSCICLFIAYIKYIRGELTKNFITILLTEVMVNAVSPNMFFALLVASFFVSNRLKKKKINCLLLDKLKESGRVNTIYFDKTGTLTENTIRIYGYCLGENKQLNPVVKNITSLTTFDNYRYYVEVMACCHSLNIMNGEAIGDPAEEQLFKASEFSIRERVNDLVTIKEVEDDLYYQIIPSVEHRRFFKLGKRFTYRIVKSIEFTSERKKMTSIIYNEGKDEMRFTVLTKGAPESMKEIFTSSSLPANYDEEVLSFSEKGLRVLAFGYKKTNSLELSDNEYESQQNFIGFVLLNNPLKSTSASTIRDLQRYQVNCGMITGDNLYTGISVGLQCNLISNKQGVWVGEFKAKKQYIKWHFLISDSLYQNIVNKDLKESNSESFFSNSSFNSQYSIGQRQHSSNKNIMKGDHATHLILKESLNSDDIVFALEGDALEYLQSYFKNDPTTFNQLVSKTVIFGRARPHQKALVIKTMQKHKEKDNFCIGFVGDGANDCNALQTANLGLSIGGNESSIASSFSTTINDIKPVMDIILESKFILENTFQIFKFCCTSSICFISSIAYLNFMNRRNSIILGLINFPISLPIFLNISMTLPNKMTPLYPKATLMEREILIPILALMLLMFLLVTGLFISLYKYWLYKPTASILYYLVDVTADGNYFVETCLIWFFSYLATYFLLIVNHRSFPFKRSIYSNTSLTVNLIIAYLVDMMPIVDNFFQNYEFKGFVINLYRIPNLLDPVLYGFILYILGSFIVIFLFTKTIDNYYLKKDFKKILGKYKEKNKESIALVSN